MNAVGQPLAPTLTLHRFSDRAYRRLLEIGVLAGDEAAELRDGVVVHPHDDSRAATPWLDLAAACQAGNVRRFSVADYHKLLENGLLDEDDDVELLDGLLVSKMSRNPPHDVTVALVLKAIAACLPVGWHVRVQSAITTDTGEPEPDLAVVRGVERDYLASHPRPMDAALVIEVADTTLARDREVKGPIYARALIQSYWIVNIADDVVEVHSAPTGLTASPGYDHHVDRTRGETVPLHLDGVEIARLSVDDLLP